MRGKNILTHFDKLKGWVLLCSIMLCFALSWCAYFENKSSLEFKFVGYTSILPMNLKVPWVAYVWSKSELLWVQIQQIRLCEFVLVMLEVWSCFQKFKKKSSLVICNVLPEPYVIFHEKPLHIYCLMFCWVLSNCVTLVRYSSCFLDHKHVHVPSICYISTLEIGTTIHPFHINKYSMYWWPLS